MLDRIATAQPQEEAVWTTLFGLAGPGRPFDAEDAPVYRQAIGEARELNGLISGFGVRAQQAVEAYHLTYDKKMFEERVAAVKKARLLCGTPTGVPPATYGAAPAFDFARVAREHPTK